jgi:hypothetical protein
LRSTRFISTGLGAVLALALTPALAAATPGTLTDTDFAHGNTGTATAVSASGVALKRSMVTEGFDDNLFHSMDFTKWDPSNPDPTIAGGVVSINGARVYERDDSGVGQRSYAPGQVLEFTATFSATAPNQHIGFGVTFNDAPWAMFSTVAGNTLVARTNAGVAPETTTTLSNAAALLGTSHTYRIEWDANQVRYYVDTVLVATHAVSISAALTPIASDFSSADAALSLDSIGMQRYPATGQFESRVLDATDAHATWGALTGDVPVVTGTAVAFETRTGNSTNTSDPSWSAYAPVGAGGAIASPSARYIQYRATLSTTNNRLTPSLSGVAIAYDIPAAPPSNPGNPTGPTGGGQGSGGSGSSGGSGGTGQGGGAAADKSAPTVTFKALSSRVSKSGTLAVRVGCPAGETSCKIAVALKSGKTTLASKKVTVNGGKTANVSLRLSRAARRQLAKRGRLKVKAVIGATDSAGNKSSKTLQLTLRA